MAAGSGAVVVVERIADEVVARVAETSDVTRDTVLVPVGTMLAVVDMTGLAFARLTQEPDQVRGGAVVVKVPARCRRRKMTFLARARHRWRSETLVNEFRMHVGVGDVTIGASRTRTRSRRHCRRR